ncbi:hypothetical protein BJX76DRAFT_353729 [Aspergillus varians]
MEASNMGQFKRLPAELRLLIWERALSDGSTSIMRTSRAIYEDISGRLYDTIEIHLYPLYDDPEKDCFWDGLWEFPYNKVKLVINLYSPDPQDKAQFIMLWSKIRGLAAILQQTSGPKSIEIRPRQYNGHKWQQSRVRGHSSDNGYTLLSIPFCRLPAIKVRTMSLPHSTDPLPTNTQHQPTLDSLITDIDFLYDTKLDTLPGRAASMLRLEQFATWSQKPLGKLPYETRTLRTIRKYPDTIVTHDPALKSLRLRYSYFDTLHLSVYGKDTSTAYRPTLDWQDWLKTYPDGIPELTEQWLCSERKRVYTRLG